jgi:chemotaxis protein methyltransferase CheR
MTVREFAPFDSTWDLRLLASDIDTDVLQSAEQGLFSSEDLEPVAESFKKRYFQRGFGRFAGQARAKPELRELITFRQLNLIADVWPIRAMFDVIFCRNVMIYFDVETQQRVVEHLTRHLAPGGYLLLGHSENIQWASHYLRPLGNTIFQLAE